jgi:hypothetical protein
MFNMKTVEKSIFGFFRDINFQKVICPEMYVFMRVRACIYAYKHSRACLHG